MQRLVILSSFISIKWVILSKSDGSRSMRDAGVGYLVMSWYWQIWIKLITLILPSQSIFSIYRRLEESTVCERVVWTKVSHFELGWSAWNWSKCAERWKRTGQTAVGYFELKIVDMPRLRTVFRDVCGESDLVVTSGTPSASVGNCQNLVNHTDLPTA